MKTKFMSILLATSCLLVLGQVHAITFTKTEARKVCKEIRDSQISQTSQCNSDVNTNYNIIEELTKSYLHGLDLLDERQKEALQYLEYNSQAQGEYLELSKSKIELTDQLKGLEENIQSTFEYYNKLIEGISPNFSNRYATELLQQYSKEKKTRVSRLESERESLSSRLTSIRERLAQLNIELAPYREIINQYNLQISEIKSQTQQILKRLEENKQTNRSHDTTGFIGRSLFDFGHGDDFDMQACISLHMSLNKLPEFDLPRLPNIPRGPWGTDGPGINNPYVKSLQKESYSR